MRSFKVHHHVAGIPEHFNNLVQAVAERQDKDAFAELFHYFAPRLNSYLQRSGSSTAQSEEIVQDTLLVLWQKAALFHPEKANLGTWLYRVARNRRIDLMRRGSGGITVEIDDMLTESLADTTDIEGALQQSQREDTVRIAMKVLPPEQLDLVKLSFYEGLSHGDIAEKTGIPLGTVKSRLRLAFTRIRRVLEENPDHRKTA
jgi:RNA polymerase sigma factor (sigma-70 family)